MVTGLNYLLIQGLIVGPLSKKTGVGRVIKLSLFGSFLRFLLMLLPFDCITMLVTVGLFNLFNALLRPAI
jgi:MFS transporter, DHA1 family, multidrug resistance protein